MNTPFNTDTQRQQLFKQHSITVSKNNKISTSNFLVKRSDIHDLYRNKYGLSEFPWGCVASKISSNNEWTWLAIKNPIIIADNYKSLRASKLFKLDVQVFDYI